MDDDKWYRAVACVVCVTAYCVSPKYGLAAFLGVCAVYVYNEFTLNRLYDGYDRQADEFMYGLSSKLDPPQSAFKEGDTIPNPYKKNKPSDEEKEDTEKVVDMANKNLTRGIRPYTPEDSFGTFRLNARPAYHRKPPEAVSKQKKDDREWLNFCNTRPKNWQDLPEELVFAPVTR